MESVGASKHFSPDPLSLIHFFFFLCFNDHSFLFFNYPAILKLILVYLYTNQEKYYDYPLENEQVLLALTHQGQVREHLSVSWSVCNWDVDGTGTFINKSLGLCGLYDGVSVVYGRGLLPTDPIRSHKIAVCGVLKTKMNSPDSLLPSLSTS